MPPNLALLLGIIFIGYLFWIDLNREDKYSNALWVPFLWIFFAGSRYLSHWVKLAPSDYSAHHEGSPIDALVFGALLLAGFVVLKRRKIDWIFLLSQNKLIFIYLVFCCFSIVWSDYPFISFKRFIKELGNPIMILVILTDKHSFDALTIIIKRIAYLLLPLSIIFFKYFPSIGRMYHPNGTMFASGVCMEKNGLGMLCLICGSVFLWELLVRQKGKAIKLDRDSLIKISMILVVAWLLYRADSATSLICLIVSVALMFLSRMETMAAQPGRIINFILIGFPIAFIFEQVFDVTGLILYLLDRDPSYTTRVPIWEFLSQIAVNDFIGAGYQSFWLGERLDAIWDFTGRTISQAHNGYLEQYLNLGYVGVGFIIAIIISGLLKVKRQLYTDYPAGVLCLCFIIISILYNFTEAAFYGINNLWMLLLLSVMEVAPQDNPQEEILPMADIADKAESRI
jgi:O-antigen ligase